VLTVEHAAQRPTPATSPAAYHALLSQPVEQSDKASISFPSCLCYCRSCERQSTNPPEKTNLPRSNRIFCHGLPAHCAGSSGNYCRKRPGLSTGISCRSGRSCLLIAWKPYGISALFAELQSGELFTIFPLGQKTLTQVQGNSVAQDTITHFWILLTQKRHVRAALSGRQLPFQQSSLLLSVVCCPTIQFFT